MKRYSVILLLAATLIIVLVSCTPEETLVVLEIVAPSTVLPGEHIDEIKAITNKPVDSELIFFWQSDKGEVPAGARPDTVSYTAPDETGIDTVTVTVNDGEGNVATLSAIIRVIEPTAVIRVDALAIPAGWMSSADDPASYIELQGDSSDTCHTGADCLQINYRAGGVWGGIYWWPASCGQTGTPETWGNVRNGDCGINVLISGNFAEIKQLTFWARGEQGNEVIEFKVGNVDVLPQPGYSTGKISLTPHWEQYKIDLRQADLTNAIGMFSWIAADLDNPGSAVFYLDDIQFEGLK